jgi:hypothetical protein
MGLDVWLRNLLGRGLGRGCHPAFSRVAIAIIATNSAEAADDTRKSDNDVFCVTNEDRPVRWNYT